MEEQNETRSGESDQGTSATSAANAANASGSGPDASPLPSWMRWLGLTRRKHPVRFIRVRPTVLGGIVWVTVIMVVGMAGFAEYSMSSHFCNDCHLMQPYYEAWHESTHKEVDCVDCHMLPGLKGTLRGKFEASVQAVKYITQTYGSKPHAEVRDESCLRAGCHETRLLQGRSEWEVPTQRGQTIKIHFDHTPHLGELRRGKQLRCVSCHSQIVQGQHIVVTLDSCFNCHFKGQIHGRDEEVLGGCGSCHSAPKGQIRLESSVFNHEEYLSRDVACFNCHSEAIKGDGEVPKQICWTCHNQPEHLARYGESSFIHEMHITEHKVECSNCHIQIEHHLTADAPAVASHLGDDHGLQQAGSCSQCHESMHAGPLELYRGVGGRGVPELPSPMYTAQVDCIACHQLREFESSVADVVGQTYIAAQAACNDCHGVQYENVLDNWKSSMDDMLARAEVDLEKARRVMPGVDQLDPQESLRLRRLFDDAEYNVRFVRLGHGVHNVNYAVALLNYAMENCQEIADVLDGSDDTSSQPEPNPYDDQGG